MEAPALLDGYKFDLRLYVLVVSLKPLTVYLYKEGMARFATTRYCRPSDANLHEVCMHLTNYSLNKHADAYVHAGQGAPAATSPAATPPPIRGGLARLGCA